VGLCTAIDLQDCLPDLIRNADHIRRYVVELCELIRHEAFWRVPGRRIRPGPRCRLFHGAADLDLVDQRPFCEQIRNNAYLDIFSCKGYDPAVVEAFSKDFSARVASTATVTLRLLGRDRGRAPRLPRSIRAGSHPPRAMNPTTVKEFFQLLPGRLDSDAAEDV